MSNPVAPQVDCDQQHPSIPVTDVLTASDFYTTKLGFRLGFTWGEPPTMAGVNLGEVQIFLRQGTPAPQGCALYFVIGAADELCDFHRAHGVEIVEPVTDRAWGFREYTVRDLHGYRLIFGQRIHKDGPPLLIERVEVPLRLERRLAAVLRDLAEYKRMSLSSCVEETLLHTFTPFGDGVASPHTKSDLRQIQRLMAKHGIDYDSHGSYRFVESTAGTGNREKGTGKADG
jgi:catechol 2,3-dioxygenase-like lactoylglutathione lyase family enzyme